MLIVDQKLNIEELKSIVPTMAWTKLPRHLNKDNQEYFYCGRLEDSFKIVKITVRPSLWMSITETFKNRKPMDGSEPEEGYRGPLVDWGHYLEVNIDDKFLDKIKEISKDPEIRKIETVSW